MKHIAKRRIKNTAQMLAVLGLVGMSTFGMNAYAQDLQDTQEIIAKHDTSGTNDTEKDTDTIGIKKHAHKNHATQIRHDKKSKMNFTDAQKQALKEAHTLRKQGKRAEAQAVLDKAGVVLPIGGSVSKKHNN